MRKIPRAVLVALRDSAAFLETPLPRPTCRRPFLPSDLGNRVQLLYRLSPHLEEPFFLALFQVLRPLGGRWASRRYYLEADLLELITICNPRDDARPGAFAFARGAFVFRRSPRATLARWARSGLYDPDLYPCRRGTTMSWCGVTPWY